MQGPRDQLMATSEKFSSSKWRSGTGSLTLPKLGQWFGVERLLLISALCTLNSRAFRNSTHVLS